eukprot:12679255-Alexandrium_andersonii.AAC.1
MALRKRQQLQRAQPVHRDGVAMRHAIRQAGPRRLESKTLTSVAVAEQMENTTNSALLYISTPSVWTYNGR